MLNEVSMRQILLRVLQFPQSVDTTRKLLVVLALGSYDRAP